MSTDGSSRGEQSSRTRTSGRSKHMVSKTAAEEIIDGRDLL